jgi:AcrR family transcriptional regulator
VVRARGDIDVAELSETSVLILVAAASAIDIGGESAVKVNVLAREVGVAVTSLYHHFGSREGLIEAAQAFRYQDLSTRDFDAMEEAFTRCATLEDFRSTVERALRFFFSDPARARVRHARVQIYGSAFARPGLAARLAEQQEIYNKRFHDLLVPLQIKRWVKPDVDTDAFGAFFLGVMNARVLIEAGSPVVNSKAWDEFAIAALTSILAEPQTTT